MTKIPTLLNYNQHLGKKVYVYWNLTKKCWSVRHKGKVLFHTGHLMLDNCKLKVSESGRQRVLRENKKYVHAGVEGVLAYDYEYQRVDFFDHAVTIGYNPRKGGTFFEYDNGVPRLEAQTVYMNNHRKVYAV